MTRPLVSVIVPVFNGAAFLREALDSLFAQSYEPFEAIVVDDGSEDDSAAIAESYPIAACIRQENRGDAAARNTGIRASSGELIAFLDADDIVPPGKLDAQVGHLLAHPEVGCVLGRQEWINPPPWITRDAVYNDLDGIPILSAVVRRSVFDEVGFFNETFETSSDMDLMFRMRERSIPIAIVDEVVLHRRFHGGNLSLRTDRTTLVRSLRAKLERERTAGRGA